VKNAKIDVKPNNVRSAKPGSAIEVTVTAPSDTNRFLTSTFFKDVMLTSKVVMLKE
jgi:hypothetical protein